MDAHRGNAIALDDQDLRMGLDVGSTTIKAVVLDPDENILFEDYRRHHADITGA